MKRITGLMLKDFYELISAGKTLLVILALYLTAGQIFFTSIADVGMLICAMLPVNTIGYDERSGWNRYVLSFPVSRKEIVVSKYILGYLFLAAAFAVRLTAAFASGHGEGVVASSAAAALLGLVYMAIQMPVMVKFGIEQGRMWTMLFTVVFAVGSVYSSGISAFALASARYALYIAPAVVIILQAVSVRISTALYARR